MPPLVLQMGFEKGVDLLNGRSDEFWPVVEVKMLAVLDQEELLRLM